MCGSRGERTFPCAPSPLSLGQLKSQMLLSGCWTSSSLFLSQFSLVSLEVQLGRAVLAAFTGANPSPCCLGLLIFCIIPLMVLLSSLTTLSAEKPHLCTPGAFPGLETWEIVLELTGGFQRCHHSFPSSPCFSCPAEGLSRECPMAGTDGPGQPRSSTAA